MTDADRSKPGPVGAVKTRRTWSVRLRLWTRRVLDRQQRLMQALAEGLVNRVVTIECRLLAELGGPWFAWLLFAMLVPFAIWGMHVPALWYLIVLVLLSLFSLGAPPPVAASRERIDAMWLQLAFSIVLVVTSWFRPIPGWEPHLAAIVPLALLLLTCIAHCFAVYFAHWPREWDHRGQDPEGLDPTALQAELARKPAHETGRSFGANLMMCLVERPVEILAMPALAVLVFRPDVLSPPYLGLVALSGLLLLSWLLVADGYTAGPMTPVRLLLNRWFTYGGCWVLTVLLIVLAVCYVMEVSQVTTILKTNSWVIGRILFAGYLTCWLFETWLNRLCNARLLRLLVGGGGNLRLSLGSMSFVLEGKIVTRHDLLRALAQSAVWRPLRDGSRSPWQDGHRWLRISRRCDAFFVGMNTIAALAAISVGIWFWNAEREPVLSVERAEAGTFDLHQRLFAAPEAPSTRGSRILICASGGGSRAAVFTAAALHGLHELGAESDVLLGSGVSGGGVALAWFAAHRTELQDHAAGAAHWTAFYDAMALDYFSDVLAEFGSLRLACRENLGAILAEQFERSFAAKSEKASPALTLGAIDTGLILNTSLQAETIPGAGRVEYSEFAGTRLLLTNLADSSAFPSESVDLAARRGMRCVSLMSSDIALPIASALTANFPPVFRDAKIEVREPGTVAAPSTRDTYWVTDGGVVENRGDVALLHALVHHLERELVRRRAGAVTAQLPDIHVVVLDASAIGTRYNHLPGAGAIGAASSRMAEAVASCLRAEAERRFAELLALAPAPAEGSPVARLMFHTIGMPAVFRVDGGIGTHWMLPPDVLVRSRSEPDAAPVELSKEAVLDMIWNLFAEQVPRQRAAAHEHAAMDIVGRWIADEARPFARSWNDLRRALSR